MAFRVQLRLLRTIIIPLAFRAPKFLVPVLNIRVYIYMIKRRRLTKGGREEKGGKMGEKGNTYI